MVYESRPKVMVSGCIPTHVLGEGSPLLNHHQQERSSFTYSPLSQAIASVPRDPSSDAETTTELPTWKKRKETGKNAS
jgi:hypothetical protein